MDWKKIKPDEFKDYLKEIIYNYLIDTDSKVNYEIKAKNLEFIDNNLINEIIKKIEDKYLTVRY